MTVSLEITAPARSDVDEVLALLNVAPDPSHSDKARELILMHVCGLIASRDDDPPSENYRRTEVHKLIEELRAGKRPKKNHIDAAEAARSSDAAKDPRPMLNELAQKLSLHTDGLTREEIRFQVLKTQYPTITLQGRDDAYLEALVGYVPRSMAHDAERARINAGWKTDSVDLSQGGYRQDGKPRTQAEIAAAQRQDVLDHARGLKMSEYKELMRQRRIAAGTEHADPKMAAEAESVAKRFADTAARDLELQRQATKEAADARRKQLVENKGLDQSWRKPLSRSR